MKLAKEIAQICFGILGIYWVLNGFSRPTQFDTWAGWLGSYLMDATEVMMWIAVLFVIVFYIRKKLILCTQAISTWYLALPEETKAWLRP
jgi:hypothetical protein